MTFKAHRRQMSAHAVLDCFDPSRDTCEELVKFAVALWPLRHGTFTRACLRACLAEIHDRLAAGLTETQDMADAR